MLCPLCLNDVKFNSYQCPDCKQNADPMYVQGYGQYPPVVVNAIGFRQHGKTVYFAALFYLLKELAHVWDKFYATPLSEKAIETIKANVALLQSGTLPDATPKNFPQPTVVRVKGVPDQQSCSLLFYDTGGECFEKASNLVQYAKFVGRARTAMFLVSIPNLEDPAAEMDHLINSYLIGMAELKADISNQHLVVVYTKGDDLLGRFKGQWGDLLDYLIEGSIDRLADPARYIRRMGQVSNRLREFTSKELGADDFLHKVTDNFRSVSFSVISSLGAHPQGRTLSSQIVPRRVLDPLLWMMERSLPGWKQAMRRWF